MKKFKTKYYYLKIYKYMVFILIDYNNLFYFMDIKNLSF